MGLGGPQQNSIYGEDLSNNSASDKVCVITNRDPL